MKKGKVFGKAQIALVLMVLALGAAVWLNMRFSSDKYLGEATYVGKDDTPAAVTTGAKVKTESADYFTTAAKEREKTYEKVEETVKETLKSGVLTDEDKKDAVALVKQLADRMAKCGNMETLLKAKGFEKAVVVIGDNNVNVVVSSDGLTTAQTMQIQDIVTAETSIPLGNIKIVAVK